MNTAMNNSLLLLALAVLTAWLIRRRFSAPKRREQPPVAGTIHGGNEPARLARLYARKRLYRIGVLGFCLLAGAVYLSGGGRLVPFLLLCGAGFCQYGAIRQRTTEGLARLLRER